MSSSESPELLCFRLSPHCASLAVCEVTELEVTELADGVKEPACATAAAAAAVAATAGTAVAAAGAAAGTVATTAAAAAAAAVLARSGKPPGVADRHMTLAEVEPADAARPVRQAARLPAADTGTLSWYSTADDDAANRWVNSRRSWMADISLGSEVNILLCLTKNTRAVAVSTMASE